MIRSICRLLAAGALLTASASDCYLAPGDSIFAGDLARVFPEFAAIHPEVVVALSPKPGVVRVLRPVELARFAREHKVEWKGGQSACFVRPGQIPDRARIEEAMRTTLPDAEIEVIDFRKAGLPTGSIEFPASGLPRPSIGELPESILWRGVVRSAGRTYPIWARAKVVVRKSVVVAAEALAAGERIQPAQLRIEERVFLPGSSGFLESTEQVSGATARTAIAPNTIVRSSLLRKRPEIARGDQVTVVAISGGAQMNFQAKAESAGAAGDFVMIRNPWNGRRFRGRVESAGKVVVE